MRKYESIEVGNGTIKLKDSENFSVLMDDNWVDVTYEKTSE